MSQPASLEPDEALEALVLLDRALAQSIDEMNAARTRVGRLMAQHDAGLAWREMVVADERPLVVERVTAALDRLSAAGSRFRRAEARALHAEGLSMERIASLFGVSRQRVSALLRERD